MHKPIFALVVALGLASSVGHAQQERGNANTTVGGKKVSIDYGQPALKGRKFADLATQLPGDRMWRAGSGQITILTTDGDLLIGGKRVPAGKYSVYIHCPENGSYSLVLNRDLGQPLGKVWAAAPANVANDPYPHSDYTKEIADKEVARAPLRQASVPPTDVLKYSFTPAGNGTTLTVSWGDQGWVTDIQPAR